MKAIRSTATWQLTGYTTGGDAVAFAGSERAACRMIRNQLAKQGEYMDEKERKRSERALSILRQGHVLFRDEYETGWGDNKKTVVRYVVNLKRSVAVLRYALNRIRFTMHNSRETLTPEEVDTLKAQGFILILK